MVATRLLEVTNKGTEWARGGGTPTGSHTQSGSQDADSFSAPPLKDSVSWNISRPLEPSFWDYTSGSVQWAAETTYTAFTGLLSSLVYADQTTKNEATLHDIASSPQARNSHPKSASTTNRSSAIFRSPNLTSWMSPRLERVESQHFRRYRMKDLAWVWKNPYSSVRGRHERPSSVAAVRSLLALVPVEPLTQNNTKPVMVETIEEESSTVAPKSEIPEKEDKESTKLMQSIPLSNSGFLQTPNKESPSSVSSAETASQLAEGTIRALRDLALEEAVDLQEALRYWNSRWEQPLWSWLEAGPWVWFSPDGYSHQLVGQRVAQIQAVLARRCSAIGELQQHLLRAGWQEGVAQWGVLGHGGGEWAAVAGFDRANTIMEDSLMEENSEFQSDHSRLSSTVGSPSTGLLSTRRLSRDIGDINRLSPGTRGRRRNRRSSQVFVHKNDGGGVFVEDPSFLAEWSVEAIALIRKQLYRAGNGLVELPYESNWRLPVEAESDDEAEIGTLIVSAEPHGNKLPIWATESVLPNQAGVDGRRKQLTISDVSLLAAEVEGLLDIMEVVLAMQRSRRLDNLRPPKWFRRNWYIVALSMPAVGLITDWVARRRRGKALMKIFKHSVSSFLKERLRDPVIAICNELWKGRESFSDRKARMEAMATLKAMIRSWLDDYYPHMSENSRQAMADAMDVSLVEAKKEESMKTFYEINNVIRMSFIEMQYMKKEMMNALHAMDEMMSANDINMNIAAITPAVILAYVGSGVFRFLFYALLKLGKSREETYGSFRRIITDIERLLVMRDNPPPPPSSELDYEVASLPNRPCQLGPDDLGMVLLLVHECRGILWSDRRRFSKETSKSVSEDLAELAGERGAVSVQQQLQIITRMCRTYPFLKVISTGHMFHFHRPRSA